MFNIHDRYFRQKYTFSCYFTKQFRKNVGQAENKPAEKKEQANPSVI